jgi:hypothetical protein
MSLKSTLLELLSHPGAYFISGHPPLKSLSPASKPEQLIEPLGLEYDRTEIVYRNATRAVVRVNFAPDMVD